MPSTCYVVREDSCYYYSEIGNEVIQEIIHSLIIVSMLQAPVERSRTSLFQ